MNRVENWLADPAAPAELGLTTPEWKLRWPEAWTKACFSHGAPIPAELDQHLASGKVSLVTSGSRRTYWPLTTAGTPVEEFSACLTAGRGLTPARLAEVVLLDHDDLPAPGLPAAMAHDLGLITEQGRDQLVAAASSSNTTMIASTLKRADKQLDADELTELSGLVGQPRRFVRLANRHHLRCWYFNDWWRWPISSVVEGIREGHSPARIGALTEAYINITAHELEMAMDLAWRRGFWLGRTDP